MISITFTVPAQDKVFIVSAAPSSFAVPAQDKVFTAPPRN